MLAHGFYYRKACKLISQARTQSSDPTAQQAYVTAKGGTSGGIAVVATVFIVITGIGILAAIALPAYQDYVVRAKMAEAFAAIAPVQQHIADTYKRTHDLPEVNRTTLNGVPGAQYVDDLTMDDQRVLTVSLNVRGGTASHVLLTPRREGDTIMWTCQSPDTPPKYLPINCRK